MDRHRYPSIFATVAVLLLLLPSGAIAQLWKWSPAGKHHKAACRVSAPDSGGTRVGSGVLVDLGGLRGVLTARHILDGIFNQPTATVIFSDGTRKTGLIRYDKFGYDVGFVIADHPGLPALRLARNAPAPGELVEFVTYGGPDGKLRHFYGTARGSGRFNANVVHGDSGGAILNQNREVVGVQTTGVDPGFKTTGGIDVYPGSGSPSLLSIANFANRVKTRYHIRSDPCRPGPVVPLPPQGQAVCPSPIYPPNQTPPGNLPPPGSLPSPVDNQPPPSPKPPQVVKIDYDKLAGVVLEKMKADPEPFQGKPGKPGARGKDGANGQDGKTPDVDYGALASEVAKRLPPTRFVFEGGEKYPTQEIEAPVGGSVTFPPLQMEIVRQNGQRYYQQAPVYGGSFAVQFVPD